MTEGLENKIRKASDRYRELSLQAFDDGDRELAQVYELTADELLFALGVEKDGGCDPEEDTLDESQGAKP